MKLNYILNNLITIVCNFIISQAYYLPQTAQQLKQYYPNNGYHHRHNNVQGKEEQVAKELKGFSSDHHHHRHIHPYQLVQQQHHFADLHLKQLAESAKNPKNLRNGIYHDGAITYDLGLPNYIVLNPYDPPEIITSDHALYHEHLHHIKTTNNFTIEDFGVTAIPDSDAISAGISIETATTTYADLVTTTTATIAETKTTTEGSAKMTTTESAVTTTTPWPMQTQENMEQDIKKILNKSKEKLKILNDEFYLKQNINATISSSDATNRTMFKKEIAPPLQIYQNHESNFMPQQDQGKLSAIFPVKKLYKISKITNSFNERKMLLPADHVKSTNYPVSNFHHPHLSNDKIQSQENFL